MNEKKYQIKVRIVKRFWNGIVAVPACYNALRFCELMKCYFFTQKEIVLIIKLGFDVIDIDEEISPKD